MKTHYLITSISALTTLVVMSCSAPRLAQQNTNDDVYNSVAQAKEYSQQVPVREPEYDTQDDYGTSDPFYDMDYSSRINRFYYPNPGWRSYYDPYFDGGWYGNYGMSLGFGLGFGYNPFYGSLWSSPYYGWGNYYSPFWGYNNWGYNNYIGGGYWGGGYWGGGFYTGRTTPVDYKARPSRGGSGYIGSRGMDGLSPRSSRGQGNVISGRPSRGTTSGRGDVTTGTSRPSRTESTRPSTQSSRPARTQSRPAPTESTRPTRTETRPTREYTPPPSYSPPRSSEGSSGGGRSSGGGSYGGGGGSGRPSRGGR